MTASPWTRLATVGGTLALGACVLAGCGADDDTAGDPTASDSATASTTPSESPSGSEEPTTSPSASAPTASASEEPSQDPGSETVPTYFVADAPQGPRLFREFHQVSGDPLQAAADLVTTGEATDPDYRSLVPAGTFSSVSYDGDAFVVSLPDASWAERGGLSAREARLAVQQVLYTLQGAQQERAPLRAELDGEPSTLFGVDTSAGVKQAPQLSVLGLVNVTAPEQGATLSGTVTASGLASSFEATVPWEVRDASGEVVLDGFATADGFMGRLFPWTTEVDLSSLEPGDYTFVASTDDAGGEGPGPTEDSKDFTVG